jgi:hypothetical protein
MIFKKVMCLFLFATGVLLLATAPGPFQWENLHKIKADGGTPPSPPIPWPSTAGAIDRPELNADGGAPPAPPIPWPSIIGDQSTLNADGGAPPAPPIPWGVVSPGAKSLAV